MLDIGLSFLSDTHFWVIHTGIRIKVLQKGKITIPVSIREALGIKEGDFLTLEVHGGRIVLLPPRTVANPTKTLDALLEGIVIEGDVKEELKRASAARVEKKLERALK
jgi:AbrB family looped-hinge helix DNA binding protein